MPGDSFEQLEGYTYLVLGVVALLLGVGLLFYVWDFAVIAAVASIKLSNTESFIVYGSILGTFSILLGILSFVTSMAHFGLVPTKKRRR